MQNQHITALYQAMSAITDDMLAAARAQDWDEMVELESRCAEHVQALQAKPPLQSLPIQERDQIGKIIQKILVDDQEIRTLTSARMAQLTTMMNSTHTERKLSEAYG